MTTNSLTPSSPPEIWGGVECSVVRVNGRTENQLARSGHLHRCDDLERIAELGIRTVRYPVLWELHAAGRMDWTWADERLQRLRELGIRPIVGLLHHGAGPLAGGLLDRDFVPRLADFAATVAARYPWVDAYTPVNEPLTTARFGCMYGLWHPHARSVAAFSRGFVHQCQAVRAAMAAVRRVNPRAQLVQTEDVGRTHATPRLAYQARFENERRWLTFDLLGGTLTPSSPLWGYLVSGGIAPDELESFRADPCPPDILGMNTYVTSERFLDDQVRAYPPELVGGNGRDRYVDVPAARVRAEGLLGPEGLIRELWQRYRRPMAVTEIQLACTREEQVRWLLEFWRAGVALRRDGIDLRALTSWALFGAFDWDSLLCDPRGHYECGAFDVRRGTPRRTLVGVAIQHLIRDGDFKHPAVAGPGWWRRPIRLEHRPASAPDPADRETSASDGLPVTPIAVIGAGGRLSHALRELAGLRGLAVCFVPVTELAADDALERWLDASGAWAVIDVLGETLLDALDLELEPPPFDPALTRRLARHAHATGRPLLSFSPALADMPGQAAEVGERLEVERQLQEWHPAALLVRTGPCFSASNDDDFISRVLRRLGTGGTFEAADDRVVSPAHLPDVVQVALDLLLDGASGRWHIANAGRTTPAEWARHIADATGLAAAKVRPRPADALASPAWASYEPLPAGDDGLLPPWTEALRGCLAAMERARARGLADVA